MARIALSEASRARLRGASAFAGALLAHATLVAVAARHEWPSAHDGAQVRPAVELEVDLLPPEAAGERAVSTPPDAEGQPTTARAAAAAPRSRPPSQIDELGEAAGTAAPPGPVTAPSAAPPGSAAAGQSRPIDLGLEGGVLRGALLDPGFARKEKLPPPSIGLLSEGLAQVSAANGLSRSSAAVSAAYQSASAHAPAVGLAVFDVQSDASGSIISVTLVSEGPDRAKWSRVADDLRAQLAKRKMRVPPGGAGLLTRLRVERGQYAEDVGALNRLERGPALSQGALPPRQVADESTQSSLGRGLSPTLQVFSTERSARATRVVIISERVL